MLFTTKPLSARGKRSVVFGAMAMLVGAAVAFDLTPAPVLYRLALGLDMVIVVALGMLFVRLSQARSAVD